ncbi:MAG: NAD-dependent succinate-semialdehyde dehydrogenase [Actinomyces sp.]|uniref:NAD-dependent succinate-semialdehyde dehydrogenase n=1 Tax=Actinomyces sp. TaxID=29317 RepID=UPI0026DCF03F|nr:NAD-dependent succinate-semialdehyde dehydrogenase [Actinomyces sp.]MDO4243289.1 NAD-dependent succinate-semialdehyde dehydrogenase [Actinomyces sp.]
MTPTPTATPTATSSLPGRAPTELFVAGQFRPAASGRRLEVLDPATGRVLAEVADAGPDDAACALEAAHASQEAWRDTPARERSDILRRAFELATTTYAEDLARLMTLEMGKLLDQSRAEVAYGAEFLRWFSEEAVRVRGDAYALPEGRLRAIVLRRPVGPCLLITPWNFPLAMATRKIAPALAAGCTAILKPSELTPLTALLLARILAEAGLPAGVLSVLPTTSGPSLVSGIMADRRLRKLSFTGSTAVGSALLAQAADGVLRTSMELGGHAPFIVFDDADLEAAVEAAVTTKLRNMGQACNAADHILVHRRLHDAFVEALSQEMASQRVGPGTVEGVDVGPLISAAHRDKVAGLVDGALKRGATAVVGGRVPDGAGFFYPPTVLTGLDPEAPILRQEVFGPVAPVTAFEDEDELLRRVNADPMGLAGYLHTRDMERAMRLAERLELGMLGVNSATTSNPAAPFGGVKRSGLGREGGREGIEEYLETVYVGIPA